MSMEKALDLSARLNRSRTSERTPVLQPAEAFLSKIRQDIGLISFYFQNYGSADAELVYLELCQDYSTVTENVATDGAGKDQLKALTLSSKLPSGAQISITIKAAKDRRSFRSNRLLFGKVEIIKP